MRWIRRGLFLVGFLALSYSIGSTIDSELYQLHLRHALSEKRGKAPQAVYSSDDPFIGKIEISKIGLSAMITDGIDSKTLRRAIGHVPGTALPGEIGNFVIAAHRDTFFRGLGKVARGDTIVLTTRHGSFTYVVESTEIVGPNEVRVLQSSPSRKLTLITCYPFHFIGPAPRRFVVHASLPPPARLAFSDSEAKAKAE
jgi:sortase A